MKNSVHTIAKRLKERALRLKTDVPAMYLCMQSQDTPWPAKVMACITIAYALSPIDLIPDFIPVLGYLDDVIILPTLVALTIRLVPSSVLRACRAEAEGLWKDGRPKKWYFAIPVALIWLLLVWLILRAFLF